MKKIAILEYTFVVDENSPWQNISQFERELGLFFANKGVESQPIEVKGNSGRNVMFLQKITQPPAISKQPMTFKKPTGVK